MADKKFTTETLREKLFETIEGVLDGSVKIGQAQAAAKVSGELIKSIDIEIKFAEATSRLKLSRDEEPGPIRLGTRPGQLLDHEP